MFCTHTQSGVALVDTNGNLRPCCRARTESWQNNPQDDEWSKLPTIFDVETLDELHKKKPYIELQNELASGEFPKICVECKVEEREGFRSRRVETNDLFSRGDLHVKGAIQDLEIALDFTCNMMCRMCNPGQSSKWGSKKELVKELNLYNMVSDADMTNTKYRTYQEQMKHVLDNTDLSHLRFIKIEGGEPFYSKHFEWFLDKLDREVIEPDKFELMIVTNGSVYPKKTILDKLLKFPNLVITFSIDAIEELAECIRWGVDWKTIDGNMRQYNKHKDAGEIRHLMTNSVISILNFNRMKELTTYFSDIGIETGYHLLTTPDYLSIYQLPKDVRMKHLTGNKKIDDILMADIDIAPELDRTLKHIELLDTHTDTKFEEVNKEALQIIKDNI
tara:strand:- start:166 stop:1335 length:1170 start_codon:yes stop_codon:yes gene_type:complete